MKKKPVNGKRYFMYAHLDTLNKMFSGDICAKIVMKLPDKTTGWFTVEQVDRSLIVREVEPWKLNVESPKSEEPCLEKETSSSVLTTL